MLSHFTEQYDTKYIFKGVSWNKDDCHSEEKKKGFLISLCLFSVKSLNSYWKSAITHRLPNKRNPLLSRGSGVFPLCSLEP